MNAILHAAFCTVKGQCIVPLAAVAGGHCTELINKGKASSPWWVRCHLCFGAAVRTQQSIWLLCSAWLRVHTSPSLALLYCMQHVGIQLRSWPPRN